MMMRLSSHPLQAAGCGRLHPGCVTALSDDGHFSNNPWRYINRVSLIAQGLAVLARIAG